MMKSGRQLLDHVAPVQTWSWTESDFILYALCLGMGDDPTDLRALSFVYEDGLKVVPTMATVLAWVAEPTFTRLGVDPLTALHGQQKIVLHRQPAAPATVRLQGKVIAVQDKGMGRGALISTEHLITDASDGEPIATLTTSCFGRSEGGMGSSGAVESPHVVPGRSPDRTLEYRTAPNLALLYRLTGDRNPIHADPAVALRAGFPQPILHGQCTFGMSCRAVLETYAGYDPSCIVSHQARFSAPVFPGETLLIDLWRDGEVVSFEVRVKERDVVVIKHGKSVLRSA